MSDEREESAIARSSRILAERLIEQAWGRGLGIAEERQRVLDLTGDRPEIRELILRDVQL